MRTATHSKLPNSPYPESYEICYFTKDDEKKTEEKTKNTAIKKVGCDSIVNDKCTSDTWALGDQSQHSQNCVQILRIQEKTCCFL